jgi:hypothetical protein
MWVAADCDLGLTLSHGGGYPGYGSHVLLMVDHGVGVFALANRTYAGPSGAVWDAAVALNDAGFLAERSVAVSADLADAYRTVGAIYSQRTVAAAGERLAMNFLMDRDAESWRRDLIDLKKKVGECETAAPVKALSSLAGDFAWRCTHGRVEGSVLLAPTKPPRIQAISLDVAAP